MQFVKSALMLSPQQYKRQPKLLVFHGVRCKKQVARMLGLRPSVWGRGSGHRPTDGDTEGESMASDLRADRSEKKRIW